MKLKAYKIIWWTIPLLVLLFVFNSAGSFDLQLHDTYIVLASLHLAAFLILTLLVTGSIYWLMRKHRLLPALSLIHSFFTSVTLIGLALASIGQNIYRHQDPESFRQLNQITICLLLILIGFQVVLLINVIIGLIRGKIE